VRFEDFVLHLDSGTRGGFRARVLRSPFGEGAAGFSLSLAAEAEPEIRNGAMRDIVRKSLASAGARPPGEIGSALFRLVFQGPVRMLLDKSRGRLELSPNLGLRIKIKIDPTDEEAGALAGLPWELLCDGETSDFFVLSRQMSVVRYLDVPRPSHPIPFTPPLRVLAVGASPRGLDELNLEEEEKRLDALNRSSSGVRVRFLQNASIAAVREALSKDTYHVLHFMGHGSFDPESGEGMLAFQSLDGSCDLVSGKVFAALLQDVRSLGVVVLNACNTARARHQPNTDPFRGVATALVLGGIPAVVAMQQPISDRAAIGFSSAFYRLLACGASIDEALTDGRQALRTADPHGCEWATPVLFLRTSEGHVFRSMLTEAPSGPPSVAPLQPRSQPVLMFLAGAAAMALLMLIGNVKVPTFQKPLAMKADVYLSSVNNTFQKLNTTVQLWQESAPIARPTSPQAPSAPLSAHVNQTLPTSSYPGQEVSRTQTQEFRPAPVNQVVVATYAPTVPENHQSIPATRFALNKPETAGDISCVRQSARLAYFRDHAGKISPVRETLDTNHDEDWLGLTFTNFDAPRIRLGVLKVINKSSEPEKQDLTDGIQELLADSLYNTNRFDLVEQKRIREVQEQQAGHYVTEPRPASIINIGKVLGAQYLVYATLNEWRPGSRIDKMMAEIDMTFTLAEVSTGQILFVVSEHARMGRPYRASIIINDKVTSRVNTRLGFAVRACANKAAYRIADFLKNRKWKGSVVEIKKASIFINAGSQQGMAPQTRLSVQSVMGVVKDRESGTILGEDLRSIGILEVINVQKGFSIAEIKEGCKGLKVGDRVELATEPGPPEVSRECAALEASLAP
jgi:CHAT domain-containing protein/TolB-like protein